MIHFPRAVFFENSLCTLEFNILVKMLHVLGTIQTMGFFSGVLLLHALQQFNRGDNACATSLTLRGEVRLARLMCFMSGSSSMAKDTLLLRSNKDYPCYGALRAQCAHYSYDVTIGVGKLSEPPRILLRTYARRHVRC